jgi:transposase InsO family protein
VPEKVYFDNGSQYRTKWMIRACSKMGVRLLYAKPYSPEATGKPERFRMADFRLLTPNSRFLPVSAVLSCIIWTQ